MATQTKTFDLSTISNEKGSATYGFTYSGGVLTPANKGNHNTYAYAKLTFDMPNNGTLTLGVTQSSEKSYDFGLVSNLDTSLAYSTSVDSSVKYNAKGLDGSTTITYDNVTKGSHFITVKYKKDGSQSTGSDAFNITSLVATYEAVAEGVTTFDLSTLELAEGTYDITVVAKADGYKDSAESEAVSYEVAAAEEDELAGTWVFNNTLDVEYFYGQFFFNFVSNSLTFDEFYVLNYDMNNYDALSYYNNADEIYRSEVYRNGVWSDSAYKTITITSKLSEVTNGSALLAWLKANATKQTASNLISFTINGISYQAESGMTWAEWVESDYNTGGWKSGGSTYIYQEVSAGSNVLFEATSNTITPNGVYTAEHDN